MCISCSAVYHSTLLAAQTIARHRCMRDIPAGDWVHNDQKGVNVDATVCRLAVG